MKYYSMKKLLATGARYLICFGERSNGKTYQALEYALTQYVKHGGQTAILRREIVDFKSKRAGAYWDNLVCNGEGVNRVKELTKNKYDSITYYAGKWFLSFYDEELCKYINAPEPFAYAFALSEMEHEKGNSYPKITTIIFDEFMTRGSNGRGYLQDEFVLFMNTISTIIRQRDNVRIIMCANTISQYCPYFEEMGLKHVRQMKRGTIDVYNYGDSGLKVAVEYCDRPSAFKPSDVYFAFDNPKLKMITGQGDNIWELDIYPHLKTKYSMKDIQFSYFVVFHETILQADIVIHDNQAFTFIHKKTTPIKKENQDIVFTTDADQRVNYMGKLTKPTSKAGKKILYFFAANKVFYSTNDIGEIMNHYLQWCNK